MMPRKHRSGGFAVVEVLVVLVIVVILAAILIPAIQASRATARKNQCSENLRNLVLATHQYAVIWSGILPGTTSVNPTTETSGHSGPAVSWSWHTVLLPYLEQREVYESIDLTLQPENGSETTANHTALERRIDRFLCPEDHGGRLSYMVNAGTWYDYDYAVTGRGRHDGFSRHHRQTISHSGIPIGMVSGPAIDTIPDGTSNTVMFGEVVHSPRVSGFDAKTVQRLWATGQDLRTLSPDQARTVCLRHATGEPGNEISDGELGPGVFRHANRFNEGIEVGRYWHLQSPNLAGTVHGLMPPNSVNCLGQYGGGTGKDQRKDGTFGLRSASSWHSGGVNLGYADGSVRFTSNEVDHKTYTGTFSVDRGEITATGERRTQQEH